MPEDMLKELERHAQRHNISVNKLVIQCCRYALDHLDPEETRQLLMEEMAMALALEDDDEYEDVIPEEEEEEE